MVKGNGLNCKGVVKGFFLFFTSVRKNEGSF